LTKSQQKKKSTIENILEESLRTVLVLTVFYQIQRLVVGR